MRGEKIVQITAGEMELFGAGGGGGSSEPGFDVLYGLLQMPERRIARKSAPWSFGPVGYMIEADIVKGTGVGIGKLDDDVVIAAENADVRFKLLRPDRFKASRIRNSVDRVGRACFVIHVNRKGCLASAV